jgi:hypothetical protein
MSLRRVFLITLISSAFLMMGNVPAPYYACQDKTPGDRCVYGYGCSNGGTCTIQANCKDNPDTEINECLVCNTGG